METFQKGDKPVPEIFETKDITLVAFNLGDNQFLQWWGMTPKT